MFFLLSTVDTVEIPGQGFRGLIFPSLCGHFHLFQSNYQLCYLSSEQTFHQSFRFARRRKHLCRNKVVELKIPFCFFKANDFLMKKKNASRCPIG